MPSTATKTTRTGSLSYTTGRTRSSSPPPPTHHSSARVHRYHWPAIQLNVWMLVMLASSLCLLGIFATLTKTQNQLLLPVPWYFPYILTVSSLTVIFVGALLYLIAQRRLLPSIVILGSFMFFVLWLTGLVVIGLELWGKDGAVGTACDYLVFNDEPKGATQVTLAWLEQKSICQSWQAAFAFGLIGCAFLLWMIILAIQVFYDDV